MRSIPTWLRVENPTGLSLLRIVVAALVGTSPEVLGTMAHEARVAALRTPPEGLGWASDHLPMNPTVVDAARSIAGIAALFGLLGLFSRAAFAVLAASSFYLFALSELVGAVRHNMHLVWFTALLAASPCGASLSIDALRRRSPVDERDVTISVWFARSLLAIVYFFPGYFKLREAGLAWALSDNLRNQMYFKWYQNAWLPAFRIDLHPAAVHAGALGVLSLELGFPLLVLSRRGRLVAALGGLGFHLFADAFMRLGFSSLWWCYVVLIDWRPVAAWLHDEHIERTETAEDADRVDGALSTSHAVAAPWRSAVLAVVGGVLVVGNLVQGFRGATQAWPFACYPTFQYVAGTTMPDLIVTAVAADGSETDLLAGTRGMEFREQRDWGVVWKLLGVYGDRPRVSGLSAFYEREVGSERALPAPPSARSIRFYRAQFSILPAARGQPPVRRDLVGERAAP